MRQSKLPLSLLNDKVQSARVHILDTESFGTTFGPKAQRKRPNLKAADMKVGDIGLFIGKILRRLFDYNQCNIPVRNSIHFLFQIYQHVLVFGNLQCLKQMNFRFNDFEIVGVVFSLFQISDPEITKVEINEINEMRMNPF